MEPWNIHPNADPDAVRTEALVSIAVSLKRIADMMERDRPDRDPDAEISIPFLPTLQPKAREE